MSQQTVVYTTFKGLPCFLATNDIICWYIPYIVILLLALCCGFVIVIIGAFYYSMSLKYSNITITPYFGNID